MKRLRSAHAAFNDGRFICISGTRLIRSDADGAQVVDTRTSRTSPKIKATIQSTLALLEGKRAA